MMIMVDGWNRGGFSTSQSTFHILCDALAATSSAAFQTVPHEHHAGYIKYVCYSEKVRAAIE